MPHDQPAWALFPWLCMLPVLYRLCLRKKSASIFAGTACGCIFVHICSSSWLFACQTYSGCNHSNYELAFPNSFCFLYVRAALCQPVICAKGISLCLRLCIDQVFWPRFTSRVFILPTVACKPPCGFCCRAASLKYFCYWTEAFCK